MKTKTLQKYWLIFWKFRKLRLMSMMEYRGDFFFWSFVSIMWTIFNFFFFNLIINVSGQIGGWSKPEMYVLLATFTIVDGFTWSFFYHNMRMYVSSIFSGELSYHLVKPIDLQYLVSVQDNSYTNIFRLIIGIGMLVISLQQMHWQFSLIQVILYVFFLIVSLFFIYCVWFLMTTLTFWFDKLDNIIEVIPSARRIWQVPRTVYSGFASTIMTVILPLGLISSIPSEFFVGRASLWWSIYFLIFTVILFIFTRWFFSFGLRKYSSVGG
jgi:ABC-2 type transport system permease protein